MAHAALGSLLRYLRRFHDLAAAEAADGELLRRYAGGDETAFTALVHRHAPMVWSVCRRLLDNEHDAEDAFQAAFLVLLRKAESLRVPQSMAAFLYGVAYRIAQKARVTAQRRRRHEAQAETRTASDSSAAIELRELRALLDEELDRLPEKYRAPLVLCYLEGKSYVEAARLLGWRDGTVCGRLARARELLRQRLSHRGLTLSSSAALVAALSESSSAPAATVAAVARMAALFALGQTTAGAVSPSVATLAQGVLQAMSMAKVKTAVALVVVLGMCAAGAGWTAHWVMTETPATPEPAAQKAKTETAPEARKDYYGDPLPPGAVARMGSVQLRHAWANLAFAAYGKTLVSASSDGMVRFWDVATGRQVRQTRIPLREQTPGRRTSEITGLSPDGKVVAAFEDESLDLYDTATGEKLRRLHAKGFVLELPAFSGNSKLLAAWIYGADKTYALRLWDLSTGKEYFHLEKLNRVRTLILSPDGSRLAYETCENEWVLHVLDTATGRELAKAPVDEWCFAFSPDNQMLATARNFNNTITPTLWEANGLKKRATLRPARFTHLEIPCLTFSPDGKLLVMGGLGAIVIWDVATGKERRRLDDRTARRVVFSPDGKTLACAGALEVRLWNLGTGERLHTRAGHDNSVESVAVSPDGRVVASADLYGPVVRLWDAATGKPLSFSSRHANGIRSCAFTSDGRLLISGCSGVLRFLDASTGVEQRRFIVKDRKTGKRNQEILVSHLSADGKHLAVISEEENRAQLTLWDALTGEQLAKRSFKGFFSSFTPDGEGVTVDGREQLTIEDTRTGQHLLAIPGDLGQPTAFSSDGQFMAVGMRKSEESGPGDLGGWTSLGVRVVEMASREELFHINGSIHYTTFSPDGRRLVTAGEDGLRLWDVPTGELLVRRPSPTNPSRGPSMGWMRSLAFLPNGRDLVTGMSDGTLLVWDMTPPLRKPEKTKDLGPKELDMLWSDLAGDARKAQQALFTMAAVPKQALPFLAEHLHPAAQVDPKRVDKLLADLDSEQFTVRDAAARELDGMGPQIEPALQRVLESKPSLEVRNRVRAIQEKQRGVPPAATLRTLRAIRVLEAIGTTEARELLRKLAGGAAGARETREAKAVLERHARRAS